MALPTTAAEWLALAEETRSAARRMSTPDARVTMQELADQYERLSAACGGTAYGRLRRLSAAGRRRQR